MAEQKKDTRSSKAGVQEEEATAPTSSLPKKGAALKEALDSLLDDIDDILEENAEEFVAGYVQRGGQ
jgi:ubiquitin-like protein Pup